MNENIDYFIAKRFELKEELLPGDGSETANWLQENVYVND